VLADTAGIKKDDVRLFLAVNDLKTFFGENAGNELGIPFVHLASEGAQKHT